MLVDIGLPTFSTWGRSSRQSGSNPSRGSPGSATRTTCAPPPSRTRGAGGSSRVSDSEDCGCDRLRRCIGSRRPSRPRMRRIPLERISRRMAAIGMDNSWVVTSRASSRSNPMCRDRLCDYEDIDKASLFGGGPDRVMTIIDYALSVARIGEKRSRPATGSRHVGIPSETARNPSGRQQSEGLTPRCHDPRPP